MLFSWANKQLEKLAETIAPVSNSSSLHNNFLAALASGNEDLALSLLRAEIEQPAQNTSAANEPVIPLDAQNTIFNNSKGNKAIHVACQHCALRVIHALISDYRVSVDTFDYQGNTGLHYAASSNNVQAYTVVKTLVQNYNATVTLRNANNQSAYDVSHDTSTRQFLLPLQLQRETQNAIDSGGPLPPGTDLSSHRLHASQQYAATNAPPTAPGAAPNNAYPISAPPSLHSQIAAGNNNTNRRMIPNDGFHSSSSDVDLQRKYGHVNAQPPGASSLPPPPVLGHAGGSTNGSVAGRAPTRSKYLAYDAVTGMASAVNIAPTPVSVHNNPPTNVGGFFSPPPAMNPSQSFPAPTNIFSSQPTSNISPPTQQQPPMHIKIPPPAFNHTTPPFQQHQPLAAHAFSPQYPAVNNMQPPSIASTLPPPPQMNRFTPPSAPAASAAATASNLFSTPPTLAGTSPATTATPQTSASDAYSSQSPSTPFPSPPAAVVNTAANFFSPPPTKSCASNVFSSPPSNN